MKAQGARRGPDMLSLVQGERELLAAERAKSMRQQVASSQQVGEIGGWTIHLVDLGAVAVVAAARTGYAVIDAPGYAVQILLGGSDRVAAVLDAGAGGVYGPLYPGCGVRMRKRFSRLRLRAWENDTLPGAGTYTLPGTWCFGRFLVVAVASVPDAEYLEPETVGGGFQWLRYTTNQLYNVTTNTPGGATDGISVRGAISVRVGLQVANGAGTVSGGTIVWWHDPLDGVSSLWGETDVQQVLVTGRTTVWCPELEVAGRDGRLFPELRSYTSTDGAAPKIWMLAFGTGGELSGRAGLL